MPTQRPATSTKRSSPAGKTVAPTPSVSADNVTPESGRVRARRPHQREAEEHIGAGGVLSEYQAERKRGFRAQRGAILCRMDNNREPGQQRAMTSTVALSRRPMAVEDEEHTSVCQLCEIEIVKMLTSTRRIGRLCER